MIIDGRMLLLLRKISKTPKLDLRSVSVLRYSDENLGLIYSVFKLSHIFR